MGDVPSGRNVHGAEHPPLTLGTAGHIDHGKTALITRLTGKNTDRLREEQERGISIELGYAELALPSGGRLSVVDVPGHERFVRAMVAGATGIDLFLLVIAADDGVMPQTAEHLAIIELLGVRDGVIALTKADLVDEELLGLASEDVREFLDGTSFAACEMVTVSARDGRGLDELLAALERVADRAETGRRTGPARLPVDRVFPLKGIGTVVTGTLWAGEITAGDTLTVEPGGVRAAVRSVQVHDHEAEVVHAGSRVGVNLRGLDRDEVRRGDWLAGSELAGLAGRRFDAWVSVLPGGRPLRSGDQVRLHHGTAQYLARVAPLEGREIAAGSAAAAVVRLDAPALALSHDRFIIRSLSPVATIAGGEVLARPRTARGVPGGRARRRRRGGGASARPRQGLPGRHPGRPHGGGLRGREGAEGADCRRRGGRARGAAGCRRRRGRALVLRRHAGRAACGLAGGRHRARRGAAGAAVHRRRRTGRARPGPAGRGRRPAVAEHGRGRRPGRRRGRIRARRRRRARRRAGRAGRETPGPAGLRAVRAAHARRAG
jgi:small GTP-binding protein